MGASGYIRRTQPTDRLQSSAAKNRKFQNREEASEKAEKLSMADKEVKIDFAAPAALRKWPSVKGERVSAFLGASPYLIIDGTLDDCIKKFMSQPASQHHLYEIHTARQSDLVSAVLSPEHIVELARLRDFL
jgi:hypothetical protein